MKTKIILILTIFLVLGGCKTTKQTNNTKQTIATGVVVNQSQNQTVDSTVKSDSASVTVESVVASEEVSEELTTIIYSPRDSSGFQSVLSVTTQNRYVVRNKGVSVKKEKENFHTKTTNYKDELSYDSHVKTVEKKDKKLTTKEVFICLLPVFMVIAVLVFYKKIHY